MFVVLATQLMVICSSSPNQPGRGINIANVSKAYLHARSYREPFAKSCLDLPNNALDAIFLHILETRKQWCQWLAGPEPLLGTLCVPPLTGSSPRHSEQPLTPPEPGRRNPGRDWPQARAAPTDLPRNQRCHHWKAPWGILSPSPHPRPHTPLAPCHSHPWGSPGPAREDRTETGRLMGKLLGAQRSEAPRSPRELPASTLLVFGTSQLPVLERRGIFLMSKKGEILGGAGVCSGETEREKRKR